MVLGLTFSNYKSVWFWGWCFVTTTEYGSGFGVWGLGIRASEFVACAQKPFVLRRRKSTPKPKTLDPK